MPKLVWYVYIYFDPRDHTPIYVGRGKGARARAHLKGAENCWLAGAIAELRVLGLEPVVDILKERYATLAEANLVEEKLIAQYGRRITGEGPLFNIMPRSGLDADAIALLWAIPEYRQRRLEEIRDHLHHLNTDPEIKKRQIEGLHRVQATKEYKINYAEGIRRREKDTAYLESRDEGIRRYSASSKCQEHTNRLNTDPEIRLRYLEGIRRRDAKRRAKKCAP